MVEHHGGFTFGTPNGPYRVRSPFTPAAQGGPGAVFDAHGSTLYQYALSALAAARAVPVTRATVGGNYVIIESTARMT